MGGGGMVARMQVTLSFDASCIERMQSAFELLAEIAADYPDDQRFQVVCERIVDALELRADQA